MKNQPCLFKSNFSGVKCKFLFIFLFLVFLFAINASAQKPYWRLSDNGKILTIYYDNNHNEQNVIGNGSYFPKATEVPNVTKVIFTDDVKNAYFRYCDGWFEDYANLTSVVGLNNIDLSHLSNNSLADMFKNCTSLTEIDISGLNTESVKLFARMFQGCTNLKKVIMTGLNTSNITNVAQMFYDCSSLTDVDLSVFSSASNIKDMGLMFLRCSSLQKVDLSSIDASNVTVMMSLFNGCENLTEVKLPNTINTTSSIKMEKMFLNCKALTKIDLSNFNNVIIEGGTANSTINMFKGCEALTTLTFPTTLVTDDVVSMEGMFEDCKALQTLDLSCFSTVENVKSFQYMFKNCESLTELDVSSFKTTSASNMTQMFFNCKKVPILDLSQFNTSGIFGTDMANSFQNCDNLTTILVPSTDLDLSHLLNVGIFGYSPNLMGEKGSMIDAHNYNISKSYAHIDQGSTNPGYFTTGSFKILYDLQGGQVTGNPTELPISGAAFPITLNNPTKDDYKFVGWSGTLATGIAADEKVMNATIPKGSKGNRKYTANWAKLYKLSFNTNGGSAVHADIIEVAGADISAEVNPIKDGTNTTTKLGYDFVSWDKDIPTTMPAKDMVITALWKPTVYNITIDYAGGALPEGKTNPSTYTIETETFTLEKPVKTGYTFDGWHTGKAVDPDGIITKGTYDDLNYTATWKVNQYTITFDPNNGEAVSKITQDYNTDITTTVADPTKEHYTFAGWNKAIPAKMPAENLTITAKWEPNSHTITFDTDGGTAIDKMTVKYGESITAPANPTKTGYTFVKWDKEIPETMPDEDLTFKAEWKINQYTITFDTDGGNEIAAITLDYNAAVTAPAEPVKKGFKFLGWKPEIPAKMPAENLTVVAQWQDNRIKIVAEMDGNAVYPANVDKFCDGKENTVTLTYNITAGTATEYKLTFEGDKIAAVEGKVSDDKTIVINIPETLESGIYKGSVIFTGDPDVYSESEAHAITITANIPKLVAYQLYTDMLIADNSSNTFKTYQWYKNDNAISGAQSGYYYEQTLSGKYTVKIATTDGKEFMSCPVKLVSTKALSQSVNVYPNPAKAGEKVTIEILEYQPDAEYTIMLFSANGSLVEKLSHVEKITRISLPFGVYSGSLISNGTKTGFKLIVK